MVCIYTLTQSLRWEQEYAASLRRLQIRGTFAASCRKWKSARSRIARRDKSGWIFVASDRRRHHQRLMVVVESSRRLAKSGTMPRGASAAAAHPLLSPESRCRGLQVPSIDSKYFLYFCEGLDACTVEPTGRGQTPRSRSYQRHAQKEPRQLLNKIQCVACNPWILTLAVLSVYLWPLIPEVYP